jgi:hypothetical protein
VDKPRGGATHQAAQHDPPGFLDVCWWNALRFSTLRRRPEAELVRYLSRLGPVGQALRVVAVVRPAFDAYVHGAEARP